MNNRKINTKDSTWKVIIQFQSLIEYKMPFESEIETQSGQGYGMGIIVEAYNVC